MSYKILLVDDEEDILEFVGFNLRAQGWSVETASDGESGIAKAREFVPDLILLDVMMPGMDGITVCGELRKIDELRGVLIALLTARGEDYSQIAGFEAGADDYIAKPIRPAVLVSRLKALLKRKGAKQGAKGTQNADDTSERLVIDPERHVVIFEGQELEFARKEFALLAFLASRPGRLFTREEIYCGVWGDEVVVGDRTIDVHIRKLRERLGDDLIQTVKGVGYKLVL